MSDYTPTIGSLFSGFGGFELPAEWHGAKCLWQSEIEPWAVEVLKKRFPNAVQLGDICEVNGAEIEPVDIIAFGSPCQDMSVAGRRAGLEGSRSGLFNEAIRIIREMREKTNGQCPRFVIWENVPGALSSNKGLDFKKVIEEITESDIPIPASGKWAKAGMVRGAKADISWRILDASYWGVPQRRKRIFIVADYKSQCSGEILFKPEGLSRHPSQSENQGQGTSEDTGNCINKASQTICFVNRGHFKEDGKAETLRSECHGDLPCIVYGICSDGSNSMKSDNPHSGIYVAETSRTIDGNGGNPTCNQGGMAILQKKTLCFEPGAASRVGGHCWEDICSTLRADMGDNLPCIIVLQGNMIGRADNNGPNGKGITEEDICYTLTATDVHGVFAPVMLESHPQDNRILIDESGNCQTLTAAMGGGGGHTPILLVPVMVENHPNDSRVKIDDSGTTQTLTGRMGTGGGNVPLTLVPIYSIDRATFNSGQNFARTPGISDDGKMQTIIARGPNAVGIPIICSTTGGCMSICEDGTTPTLLARDYKDPPIIITVAALGSGKDTTGTFLASCGEKQFLGNQEAFSGDYHVIILEYAVRRLTPSECALLQGFPHDWHFGVRNDKGKEITDTHAYKGYGNAVATVCAEYPIAGCIQKLREEHDNGS